VVNKRSEENTEGAIKEWTI